MSHEIIIGLVSAIGADREKFKNLFENCIKNNTQEDRIGFDYVHLTDLVFNKKSENYVNLPESFKLFLQMQICNEIRREVSKGYLSKCVIKQIKKSRKESRDDQIITKVILIDQIKNVTERDVLNHVYGQNYLQVTLFSGEKNRRDKLDSDFQNDKTPDEFEFDNSLMLEEELKDLFKNKDLLKEYKEEIEPNNASKIMKKDFLENNDLYKETGQQVSKLAHLSHYYFNMDLNESDIKSDIEKFIALLFGRYDDYPTNDEFGMALAFEASFRSNFPIWNNEKRQIGAAILSHTGEVISAASIRAPSSCVDTSKKDMDMIKDGYEEYKNKIDGWAQKIDELVQKIDESVQDEDIHILKEVRKYIKDTLDFHPCTHAEISAILDAAKQGVSIRNATLYSTTYPCHICAKDIITAGINRVVYLEAYPKSKNKELYPKLIVDGHEEIKRKINFEFFKGVGPRRYHFVYSKENMRQENIDDNIPPLIKYRDHTCYINNEKHIVDYIYNSDEKHLLDNLMGPENGEL